MSASKYQRLPHAGDTEKTLTEEVVYLAPKPIPTGMAAFSSRELYRTANETCADFVMGRGSFEFMIRWAIGSFMFIFLFFCLCTAGMALATVYLRVGAFWSEWFHFMLNPFIHFILGLLAFLYTGTILVSIRKLGSVPPVRFNRERRAVAYVAKRGQRARFVPWEEVIACVSVGETITEYAVTLRFLLKIGLRDASRGDVLWVSVAASSVAEAMSEWEAIRTYMEQGPAALLRPLPEDQQLELGSVEYFYSCRDDYRKYHSWLKYFFGFVVIQFCSGWTIPCHISSLINKLPRTGFPKDVIEWSKPLPCEQHAKPSAELLAQSASANKAYAEGKTFLQYFGVSEVEEDFV
ncbi:MULTISPECIES: hypothetical protein [Pseudomonas]|uniref:hypothetical protein n=1 Tax=Pseudomonas TaxID=286 RepID=UPI003003311D